MIINFRYFTIISHDYLKIIEVRDFLSSKMLLINGIVLEEFLGVDKEFDGVLHEPIIS